MATTRMRRTGAKPSIPVDAEGDRIYTEEDYAAKEALLSSLRGTHDSPGAIEGYYATSALSDLGLTPDAHMAAIGAVTAEQAAAAAF